MPMGLTLKKYEEKLFGEKEIIQVRNTGQQKARRSTGLRISEEKIKTFWSFKSF